MGAAVALIVIAALAWATGVTLLAVGVVEAAVERRWSTLLLSVLLSVALLFLLHLALPAAAQEEEPPIPPVSLGVSIDRCRTVTPFTGTGWITSLHHVKGNRFGNFAPDDSFYLCGRGATQPFTVAVWVSATVEGHGRGQIQQRIYLDSQDVPAVNKYSDTEGVITWTGWITLVVPRYTSSDRGVRIAHLRTDCRPPAEATHTIAVWFTPPDEGEEGYHFHPITPTPVSVITDLFPIDWMPEVTYGLSTCVTLLPVGKISGTVQKAGGILGVEIPPMEDVRLCLVPVKISGSIPFTPWTYNRVVNMAVVAALGVFILKRMKD